MQCTATSKRSGNQCKRNAAPGSSKCDKHGAKSLRGVDSPTFKHGRYSKDLPARLRTRFAEALSDPHQLELRSDIALIDTRVGELLDRMSSAESAGGWLLVGSLVKELRPTITGNEAAMAILDRLDATLAGHGDTDELWSSIEGTLEQRRKMVETERRHQIAMRQLVSIEQMMLLTSALLSSIKQHVTDDEALTAISDDFGKFLDLQAQRYGVNHE